MDNNLLKRNNRNLYFKNDNSAARRELQQRNETLFKHITKVWNLEAKQENSSLFYYIDIVGKIDEGNKNYIIGRKGMGKTAIANFIGNRKEYGKFNEHLSFKNFPFNILYSQTNDKFTSPNQYISLWEYLIYSSVCKMMARNESIDSDMKNKLKELYSNSAEDLDKTIEKWTADSFGISVMGWGATTSRTKELPTKSWIEKLDILKDIINRYSGESTYYILFDELDEDYRSFKTEEEKNIYISLLTSLFKAVQRVKAHLKNTHNIYPIIFLRSDIYDLIQDSDKNKWSDFKIDLIWGEKELKNMLAYRISETAKQKEIIISPTSAWRDIFSSRTVFMGNNTRKSMDIFSYITRSTHLRPRDYIFYIRECAKLSAEKKAIKILPEIVKEADKKFSEYLKSEIIDEICTTLPEIDEIFSVLSQIRKQTFQTSTFIDFHKKTFSGREGKTSAEKVLMILFDHGVIGNQPSMAGQQIFKHECPNALFNFTENVIIHRGLYKALQIF